jgi:hypothetical protein
MDELLDWSEKQQILDNSEISDFHPDRDDRKIKVIIRRSKS